jgi:predicted TIM-barrel fold metal-dependent hydrolase
VGQFCLDDSAFAAGQNSTDVDTAAEEAERAVKELNMPVVMIGTNMRGRNLDLPEFWPFFARMNDLNIPIIVHSDGLTSFQTHPAAGDRTGWWERGPFAADHPILVDARSSVRAHDCYHPPDLQRLT